jgi:hypothetical protein
MFPSPKELDAQSKIRIDEWVDVESERCKEIDDDYALTKRIVKMLYPEYLFTDTLGRLWGRGEDNLFYPYHFTYGKKQIGFRLSNKAAN